MSTGTAVVADPHVVTCTLAPRLEAVRTAREFTRTTLQDWGLGDLFDDVALVASELVTNALRHALGTQGSCPAAESAHIPVQPGPRPAGSGPLPGPMAAMGAGTSGLPIRISLVHRAPQVVCAVSDPSSTGPVAREADFVAESGRGLHLVDSFSRSWGWHPLAGAGKVVWAVFEAEDAPVTPLRSGSPSGRHRRSA
ncbi:ATP-binding protein [Kitasatospora sp. NPDC002227]|uniref:ATP-binding protein n=1 Tax=Kitasatospora sp. NPDC002227 TaxID=3154773 RepID=UPI003331242C